MLGRHIQHPGDLTEDGLTSVLPFVALNGDHPIGLIDEEVDPGELLRPLAAKLDHGFAIGGVADGGEKLVQLLFPLFPPLVSLLCVVALEVRLQVAGRDVAGLALLSGAYERTVVVVNHRVFVEVMLLRKSGPTFGDLALERPLTGVDSSVVRQMVLLRKSGTTARDVTHVWPLARMSPLMLDGVARTGGLPATFVNPAEKLAIGKPPPLRGPSLADWGRRRWARSIGAGRPGGRLCVRRLVRVGSSGGGRRRHGGRRRL
jgi:hypothetical protein